MSRKVFISFLGTSIYKPTLYKADDQKEEDIESTRFIQEALIKHYCTEFDQNDQIWVFTTKDALHNWEKNIHFDNQTNEEILYDGLKERLINLNLKCLFENKNIPDGKSTEEIWEIFQIVFNLIQDEDELIFDITHGFRSLPMLNMVLINYAKLLKNISVSGIFYGNWEARYPKDNKIFSPIWNLQGFESLQEWTNSAQLFLKAGYAEDLAKKMLDIGIDRSIEIEGFCQEVLTNRCISLTEGKNALAIKNLLSEKQDRDLHPVVRPIFKLIENEFNAYEENNVLNGLFAVKWCIDHDLIQQGYTIMSEFLPTYILNYIQEEYTDQNSRNTVNGFLAIGGKIAKFRFDKVPEKEKRQRDILDKVLKIPFLKDLCKRSISVNADHRNDINHGGFRKLPKNYDDFKSELFSKFDELKDLITRIQNFETV